MGFIWDFIWDHGIIRNYIEIIDNNTINSKLSWDLSGILSGIMGLPEIMDEKIILTLFIHIFTLNTRY